MKFFLLVCVLSFLSFSEVSALEHGNYPSGLGCPATSDELLEIARFQSSESADSRIGEGQCFVKVKYYSKWETISESYGLSKVVINAGHCNSSDFIYVDGKAFIKGTVSYKTNVSKCESIIGCLYSCVPNFLPWSL